MAMRAMAAHSWTALPGGAVVCAFLFSTALLSTIASGNEAWCWDQ
jgi:hypothetical protein